MVSSAYRATTKSVTTGGAVACVAGGLSRVQVETCVAAVLQTLFLPNTVL
jgi:hypothetical protein